MLQRWNTGWLRLLAGLCLLLGASELLAATDIRGVRLWRAPDNTRLVFDLTGPVQYELSSVTGPERIILDIRDTAMRARFDQLKLENTPIRNIRMADQGDGRLRVVLELSAVVTPKSFTLTPNQRYGHRLVLDLFDQAPVTALPPAIQQPPAPQMQPAQPSQPVAPVVAPVLPSRSSPPAPARVSSNSARRSVVVAIDAGHGGEDPGAIGAGGVQEKDVVLAIARELQRALNSEPGFRAELVRTGDYLIPLRQRPALARKKEADLFVSIHADAYEDGSARGASVYTLSEKGATSETARWLADSENRADLIGGVHASDDDLSAVLLDLSMTGSLASSTKVGSSVLRSMQRVTALHRSRVERAGFAVLKSPDIPSILVETGFISNPSEARRLQTSAHQQALARSIQAGIRQFFHNNPPDGSYFAWLRERRNGGGSSVASTPGVHVVRNGDSLGEIAQRYGISPQALRSANKLRSDALAVGQKLKIPQAPAVKR